ncbi:MAG TPA: hypothetical protein PLM48_02620 [Clostridia bacterium]|jgi:predicted Holliday junction resolvase-like endonuclease|nr:hypothetical protein [Clostridia bacterium]
MKKEKTRQSFYFKPAYFVLLILIDACILAGVLIPQRAKINEAQEQLELKQQELNSIEIEYQRELDNLDYMRTESYQLQQGSEKYGYHFEGDTLIPDDS